MPDLQRLGFRQARVNGTLVLEFIGLACGARGIRGVHGVGVGCVGEYRLPMECTGGKQHCAWARPDH
jgi:hypothetical protein